MLLWHLNYNLYVITLLVPSLSINTPSFVRSLVTQNSQFVFFFYNIVNSPLLLVVFLVLGFLYKSCVLYVICVCALLENLFVIFLLQLITIFAILYFLSHALIMLVLNLKGAKRWYISLIEKEGKWGLIVALPNSWRPFDLEVSVHG